MSYKSSNLYASRVFAEHPLALWAIDENINFVSLITESAKQISGDDWTFDNMSVSGSVSIPVGNPIEDSLVSKVYRQSSSPSYAEALSYSISYEDKIDKLKGSICINAYLYIPEETLLSEIQIGFLINGQEYYQTVTSFNKDRWNKIEYTKDLDSEDNIQAFIRFEYDPLAGSGEGDTSVIISGLSIGQWSEPFNSFDTGVQVQSLPSNIYNAININGGIVKCIPIDPYGFDNTDTGYLLQYNNVLLAETAGIPIVYGSKNTVSILSKELSVIFENQTDGGLYSTNIFDDEIDGGSPSAIFSASVDGGLYSYLEEEAYVPSLIFPGKGFLNQSGIYSNITAEFWMRINNESAEELKIFGPVASSDGIYIDSEFIIVKVGQYTKSYFIGQWYRPMLIHFGQTLSEIYLMINGEKVISIPIESLNISTFPTSEDDYLGFFGHHKTQPFEVDVLSIFPYIITEQVAKRRFVYGQGVENQESIVASLGGDLTYIDFPYSNYNSTISYPDRTPWTNGYSNNLKVTSEGLSLPDLDLPDIIFTNNSASLSQSSAEEIWSTFEYDNFNIQDEEYPFIKMKPNAGYAEIDSTIYFSKVNKTGYPTKSVYAVVKTSNNIDTYQSVLYFSNSTTTNYFEAKIQSGSLQYVYNNELIFSQVVEENSFIPVGINIEKIIENYSQTSQILSNLDNTSLNFAGINNAIFDGKILSLTLNNKFFLEKNPEFFDSNGFAVNADGLFHYIGTYTLVPKLSNLTTYLDVAATGYWEASVPLTYFGKYIKLENGERFYDLDLIQFNIDIPYTLYSKETEESNLYHENMSARSYVTLQTKEDVGMIPFTDYVNTIHIGNDRVLDFDNQNNLETTKFDIADSTVIFPPKDGVDFNDYYITNHILITSKGINTENMVIKRMSFSSLAFDEANLFKIGSPTGRSMSPISKTSGQYEYKAKNPVIINNETNPYLYISGNSGISVLPWDGATTDNGISFPINETLKSDFRMVGLQMYIMFNEADYFSEERLIGKVSNIFNEYLIYLTPELDQRRAKIRLVDSVTNQDIEGVKFFLNGKEVTTAKIKPFKWNSIVISLQDDSINFYREIGGIAEGVSGQLEIYPGIRINNVAAFSDINEIRLSLTITDAWLDALEFGDGSWGALSSSVTWSGALNQELIPVTVLSIDGKNIFDTYLGLSYVIGDDNSTLSVDFDSVKVLNDADWTTFEYKPI